MGLHEKPNLDLNEGVLSEPSLDKDRMVLWLPQDRDGRFQYWIRVGNVPRAKITVQDTLCSIPAVSMRVRQPLRGILGRLLERFQKASKDQTWLLPTGEAVEQCGERQTDQMLVWGEDEATPPNEERIKSHWPENCRLQRIGKNLFLVSGVEPEANINGTQPAPVLPEGSPEEIAEGLAAAARKDGDRAKEVAALTDLGILHLRKHCPKHAVAVLEEALAKAADLRDPSTESDILGNLGLAVLTLGDAKKAFELFERQLAGARQSSDRFAEKFALANLGKSYSGLGQPMQAIRLFENALALAREVGDRQDEPELLWYLGIQYAALGRKDQAIAQGQAAVDLYRKMGMPQADWLATYLQKFRLSDSRVGFDGSGEFGLTAPSSQSFGQPIIASGWPAQAEAWPVPDQTGGGPGLLSMALSAAKSMGRFLGSGMKTVSPEIQRQRLGTCTGCEHHTGLRCRVCGCFTNVKAWLPHENCPIGKWPR
jgi:tetratricopeptide (TPR) repeat protein